ncbi:hypothetical protein [Pleurocapsa sp. FMAR1]|uniref:hypothetical protein n=1 Tax=Pleurocapsa sp. FMAR1 TaxID=3040204 RepID=UPI0029C601D7|nr:hypothetical protein [Pleurocapsa sp. FMAR1]
MSSPFKTPQEFLEVKGPMYTFANSPFWLILFLVFTVLIFLWFIYASYKIKSSESSHSDPAVMSVLILTGFISLAQSAYVSGTTAVEAYLQNNKSNVSWGRKTDTPIRKVARRSNSTRQNYYSSRYRDETIRRG